MRQPQSEQAEVPSQWVVVVERREVLQEAAVYVSNQAGYSLLQAYQETRALGLRRPCLHPLHPTFRVLLLHRQSLAL